MRIGLLVVLFLAWAMGLGFVEEMKGPIREGLMLQVQQGADAHEAARSFAVTVGVLQGAVSLLASGLAVLVWFLTRKRIASR